jgi:hypothetical protein
MRPITVLNGILLGTTGSIAISLGVVVFIFLVLQGEAPRLDEEIGSLARITALFWLAAATVAASFYGHLTAARWRWWAQAVAILTLIGVSFYFVGDVLS